jgi:hypothetical protein
MAGLAAFHDDTGAYSKHLLPQSPVDWHVKLLCVYKRTFLKRAEPLIKETNVS